jgi:hypothetical protein
MPPRLLIINCSSPYFFYIPMGTFGLCDYLDQRDLTATIFNPALYPAREMPAQLLATLNALQPTHVGLVLHWQETAHGLLTALDAVKLWNPAVITFCGGFTASYFAENLLETVPGLDYVVVGDPELPVYQLLQGIPPESIANLVRRDRSGTVVRNANRWLMEQPLLDSLSFAGLHFLIDADRYLEKINTKLGFPVFLGRGCIFDCDYCGGSRQAFRLHSGRHRPVTRSLAAILADLRALKGQTRLLYICYENDPSFVSALFRAIAEDTELRGCFTLHYGAWHLLDPQFLQNYRAAFDDRAIVPLFEFSPEVYSDASRAKIKGGSTYTIDQLQHNIGEIVKAFHGRVRIEIFFSRYHPALTAARLEQEIKDIFLWKHRLFLQGSPQVHLCFDHLSTDVGSRYWEEQIKAPRTFATLLQLKQQVDEGTLYPFPVDNLCLFIPAHLTPDFRIRLEALVLVLEQLERRCHELFHILFARPGDSWLQDLQAVLAPVLSPENTPAFFAAPPLDALVAGLGQRLVANPTAAAALPFLADLIRFSRKKLAQTSRPAASCQRPGDDGCFVLNREGVSVHEQDYLDLLPFLQRLHHNEAQLPYQRTVCFFLPSGIVTLPQALYRKTFRFFEQPRTLAAYRTVLNAIKEIDAVRHNQLLTRLIEEGLLLPVPCPE